MTAGLAFLGTERWPERIHLAQRHRCSFDVKLSRLRKVGLLVEVIDRKQRSRAFTRSGRKNWRIGQREAALVEEITRSFDDLSANAKNRGLAWGSHPQMPMLHQKIDAVFFQRNGIGITLRDFLNHLHIRAIQLIATGR